MHLTNFGIKLDLVGLRKSRNYNFLLYFAKEIEVKYFEQYFYSLNLKDLKF